MKRICARWGLAVALAVGALGAFPARAGAEAALVFAGSGANLDITRLLAQAFVRTHPQVTIEVPPSLGSTGGIKAVANGAVAVGLASRPFTTEERGLGLTYVPYARSPVVMAVHPSVPDDTISAEDLVRIYQGTKTRWRNGREIVVLTRDPGDSAIEVLEREVPGFREAYAESQKARRWRTLFKMQEMDQALARTPEAIGMTSLPSGVERAGVKVLRIDGVAPTREAVRQGRYRLVRTLAFVFRGGAPSPDALAFMDFARSRTAAPIILEHGHLPAE